MPDASRGFSSPKKADGRDGIRPDPSASRVMGLFVKLKAGALRARRPPLLPAVVYFVCFCLLTWPLIFKFSTHYFSDLGDGLQNIWNLWWVNRAVTESRQFPWRTAMLHQPGGVSLLGHTLNPFNGFLAIPLLRVMPLNQTYNFILIFSFVMSGVTSFGLAHDLTRSRAASLVAGYFFAFSNYHFAHASGHLQLMSLEWIPLFILLWRRFLKDPGLGAAAASAVALFLVVLCDYYYFFYCVLAGALMAVHAAVTRRGEWRAYCRRGAFPFAAFVAFAMGTSGALCLALLVENARDPLTGAHPTLEFSLDLFSLFLPGARWRFSGLTEKYCSFLSGNPNESSISLGVAALTLAADACFAKGRRIPEIRLWGGMFLFFTLMSFGPSPHVLGREIPHLPMPYAALEWAFPPLALSGMPIRMLAMSTLALAMICAHGFALLMAAGKKGRATAGIFFFLMIIESLPGPLPAFRAEIPDYVRALRDEPGDGVVFETKLEGPLALFYQTVHQKPMVDGYIARVPRSAARVRGEIISALREGRFRDLRDNYRIRYLVTVTPEVVEALGKNPEFNLLIHDEEADAYVFDLQPRRRAE